MKKIKIVLCTLIIVFFLSTGIIAHDSWLVPDKFTLEPGEVVYISVNTGMDFPKSLNSVNPDRISSFFILGKSGKKDLGNMKVEGKSTIVSCIPGKPGTYVAAMSLKPNKIELTAKEFNEYLISDGIKKVWELRKKEGILEKDAVEFYSKYPKTIFQTGDKTDDTCLKPLKLPIEIVPMVNPYTLKKGDKLIVKVLFRGIPLADAELSWSFPGKGNTFAGTVITSETGEAKVPLEKTAGKRFDIMLEANYIVAKHLQFEELPWQLLYS